MLLEETAKDSIFDVVLHYLLFDFLEPGIVFLIDFKNGEELFEERKVITEDFDRTRFLVGVVIDIDCRSEVLIFPFLCDELVVEAISKRLVQGL